MATDPLSEAGRPSTAPSVRRGGEPSTSRSHTGRAVALGAVDADEAFEERVARSGVPQTGRRSGSLWKKAAGAMANGAFSPPKLKPPPKETPPQPKEEGVTSAPQLRRQGSELWKRVRQASTELGEWPPDAYPVDRSPSSEPARVAPLSRRPRK